MLAFLFASAADEKRRRRKKGAAPSIPAQLADGCPYHKHTTTVTSDELSEFGHELERDGRQPEAVACYALAIRNHPSKAIGWFDLATAWQYSDRANALKYYAHGLKLQPADGFRYSQLGVLLRAAEHQAGCRCTATAPPCRRLAGAEHHLRRPAADSCRHKRCAQQRS